MSVILYIEDDVLIAEMVSLFLSRRGYELLIADNGLDGIHLATHHRPQLILMDLRLPGKVDGWEAIRVLKTNPEVCHIPIVALSAQNQSSARQLAFEAGCDDYFTKPFVMHDLFKQLEPYLNGVIE